jgi:Zn-finger nucleic acid-binding protein
MSCPKCGAELIEVDYRVVKIDECSHCLGTWLDAGEFNTVSRLEMRLMGHRSTRGKKPRPIVNGSSGS